MQTENRLFEDLVKMANGFAGTVAGMGREAETNARDRLRDWIGGEGQVTREEFDAVKAMAAAARDEAEALRARLAALEAKASGPAASSSSASSAAASPRTAAASAAVEAPGGDVGPGVPTL